MWALILILLSNCTPRSRTLSAGVIMFVSTTMVRSDDGMHCSDAVVPNHITFRWVLVLDGFSCSLRAPHQFATSTMQFCIVVLLQLPRAVVERRHMPACRRQNNDGAADAGQELH